MEKDMHTEPIGSISEEPKSIESMWADFMLEFPSEENCWEELSSRCLKDGILRCLNCGYTEKGGKYSRRFVRCRGCTTKIWIFAHTFFHRIRKVRAWLFAIWLRERGYIVSAADAKRALKTAYSSVWKMFKKIDAAMQGQMDGGDLVASSQFKQLYSRRSTETPARQHPLAEEEALESEERQEGTNVDEDKQESFTKQSNDLPLDLISLQPKGREIYEKLSSEPIGFDELCVITGITTPELLATLTFMELEQVITRVPGNRFVRKSETAEHSDNGKAKVTDPMQDRVVKEIVWFLKRVFRGICRKYIQPYLAVYWCHADRKRWTLGTVFDACLNFGYVRSCDLSMYVSPAVVKVLPGGEAAVQ